MNFKEALIAHLQGEKVEARLPGSQAASDWSALVGRYGHWNYDDSWKLCFLNGDFCGNDWEFRLAPRTIMCNGVEVKAGEKEVLEYGASYYLADPDALEFWVGYSWTDHDVNKAHLQRGLVYLTKEDAIARAKAMLITQEVK